MQTRETKEKILAAHKLLFEETTTREKFESVRTLITGINSHVDKALATCSEALTDVEKFKQGEIIELGIEHLPENTEEEKERKRRALLFIRSWKQLRSEVERVKEELEAQQESSAAQRVDGFGRIVAAAKGPFGIVTLAAVVIVGTLAFINNPKNESATGQSSVKGQATETTSQKPKIQVIEFSGKKIPLAQLTVGKGQECDNEEHYHAKDHTSAKALDGSTVADPGGCGFGKVREVSILEVEQ